MEEGMKALLSVAFDLLAAVLIVSAINFIFEGKIVWPTKEQLAFYLSILALVKIHGLRESKR